MLICDAIIGKLRRGFTGIRSVHAYARVMLTRDHAYSEEPLYSGNRKEHTVMSIIFFPIRFHNNKSKGDCIKKWKAQNYFLISH